MNMAMFTPVAPGACHKVTQAPDRFAPGYVGVGKFQSLICLLEALRVANVKVELRHPSRAKPLRIRSD
jgi:hypothetical protein